VDHFFCPNCLRLRAHLYGLSAFPQSPDSLATVDMFLVGDRFWVDFSVGSNSYGEVYRSPHRGHTTGRSTRFGPPRVLAGQRFYGCRSETAGYTGVMDLSVVRHNIAAPVACKARAASSYFTEPQRAFPRITDDLPYALPGDGGSAMPIELARAIAVACDYRLVAAPRLAAHGTSSPTPFRGDGPNSET
jgi:hypothetical protein